ncbi:hypothetical protein C5167_007498 [Papaver somniferum]|nr:hypothetical protein C5167_007498 [Papaver somniferum]
MDDAFQFLKHEDVENIGYVIPTPVITTSFKIMRKMETILTLFYMYDFQVLEWSGRRWKILTCKHGYWDEFQ